MVQPEFFHTFDQYLKASLGPFVEHARNYLAGKGAVPVAKITGLAGEEICLTFTDDLLIKLVSKDRSVQKAYETALKYGFKGYSTGGRNGVFYQRDKDRKLARATDSLVAEHKLETLEDLDLTVEGLDALRKVKVISHHPSGERLVGVYRTDNHRIILLDFAHY